MKILISLLFTLMAPLAGAQTSCDAARLIFEEKARQLLIHSQEDAKRLTPERMGILTTETIAFMDAELKRRLSAGSTPEELQSYMRCLLSGGAYANWIGETNTPLVATDSQVAEIIAAYWLIRGGDAVPDTKPIVTVFRKSSGRWAVAHSWDDNLLNGFSFTARLTKATSKGTLLLMYGQKIGDPEASLKIVVLRISETGITTIYNGPSLPRARVVSEDASGLLVEQTIRDGSSYRVKKEWFTLSNLSMGNRSHQ